MKIVFVGDSITDVGRNTNNGSFISIGQGYALMIAGRLGLKYPKEFTFINNGVSGSRVVDLYSRIKMDVWNHEADVLSILVGINDVWHETLNGNGVDAERFEAIYRMLIADTIKRYPNMKIVMMEPFVTKCSTVADNWLFFHEGIQARAKITKKIAEEMGVIFLPLQNVFDDACNTVDAAYWANDGIHPSPAGHQLIADAWIDMFEENVLNK